MRKILVFLIILMICLGIFSACGKSQTKENVAPFPYEDLSEEAYIQNAHELWKNFSAYLATSEDKDLQTAVEAFYLEHGKPSPEDFTASEMMTAFEDYLLTSSGETWGSFEAMSEAEKTSFRAQNTQKMQKQIPVALKVIQKRMENEKDGGGIVGSDIINEKIITVYEDGSIGGSSL